MPENNQITDSNEPSSEENSRETPQKDKSPDDSLEPLKEITGEDTDITESTPVEKQENPAVTPIKPKSKDSNYQISLIDENLLKVIVTSKNGVRIESSVKEEKTSVETQTNEIYFSPRIDFSFQEIEVLIAIEQTEKNEQSDSEKEEDNKPATEKSFDESKEKSNYQINLINENLLKVIISTNKAVRIDSVTRDKRITNQIQSNKIYLKPKSAEYVQHVDITIGIDTKIKEEILGKSEDGVVKLIPNPEVVDLIQPPDYSPFKGAYEIDEISGYNNPFDALRKLIRKNVTIGIIAAVILHVAAAAFAFYTISKKTKEQAPEESQRLIVIQDLPDPKIKLEDVEDPNKPKVVEPPVISSEDIEKQRREIPPRKIIKPPTVSRPKREPLREEKTDTSLASDLTRELDSLRKLVDDIVPVDTTATDTTKSVFDIPDSLRNNFNEGDVGLSLYFPKTWILQDSRDLNKNSKEFEGVILIDTANGKGSMQIFIHLDKQNNEYKAEDFKKEFPMTDSNLNAFSMEPYTQAATTYYKFYIFNKLGTDKLSITTQTRQQFFDQYKNEIEAVVRSIKIRKKDDL